jgi:hypothetical protein
MSMVKWKSAGTFNWFYNKTVITQGGYADKILTIADEVQKRRKLLLWTYTCT